MKKIAILVLVFMVISAYFVFADEGIVFAFELLYKEDGQLILENIELISGNPPDYLLQPEEGDFHIAKVVGFDGKELFSVNFSTELWSYDFGRVSERPILLILPYFRNAKEANFYDVNGRLVLKVDLSEYAVCNQNGVCNPGIKEDTETCPEDCKIEKKEAVEKRAIISKEAKKPSAAWLVAFLALIALIAIIIMLKKRKKES